jgi:DNA invertase Pin-like site-specific DNA recombinase
MLATPLTISVTLRSQTNFASAAPMPKSKAGQIVEEYSDHAISGASLLRAGVQALIADSLRGRFRVVLAEAMDRLSRDQEDIAGLFKRMAYANVKIVTLSEGEITHLHVGLKGTMNALFLKDLADSEGPRRQNAPRAAWPCRAWQIGRRQFIWL